MEFSQLEDALRWWSIILFPQPTSPLPFFVNGRRGQRERTAGGGRPEVCCR